MCGIFGQMTNSVDKIEEGNIRLLGVENMSRGKDSCGIFLDGDIFHGMGLQSNFDVFMKKRRMKPTQYPYIIGHTRKASSGTISSSNAHPFGYEENQFGDYRYVGVHNGTIYNYEDLAKKYNVELFTKTNNISRKKIDSEVFLELFKNSTKTKDFSFLEEYNGGAAIALLDTQENKLYLYSGKSRNSEHYHYEAVERPLFVGSYDENNMFFSSIEASLWDLGIEDGVAQIENNTIFEISDGNFEEAKTYKIERKSVGKRIVTVSNNVSNANKKNYEFDLNEFNARNNPSANLSVKYVHPFNSPPFLGNYSNYSSRIYERGLRYFMKNDVPVEGICVFIPNYGFYKIDPPLPLTLHSLDEELATYENRLFSEVDGEFMDYWNTHVDWENNDNAYYIPFKGIVPTAFYFIEGVLVKTFLDFKSYLNAPTFYRDGKTNLIVDKISHISHYPVLNISEFLEKGFMSKKASELYFWKDGKLANSTFRPLGSSWVYNFKEGKCIEMKPHDLAGQKFLSGLPVYEAMVNSYNKRADKKVIEVVESKHNGLDEFLNTDLDIADSTNYSNILFNELKSLEKVITDYSKRDKKSSMLNDALIEYFAEVASKLAATQEEIEELLKEANGFDQDEDLDLVKEVLEKINLTINEILE